VSEERI